MSNTFNSNNTPKKLSETDEETLSQKLSQTEEKALKEEIYAQISLNIDIIRQLKTLKISEKINQFFDCDVKINEDSYMNDSSIESKNETEKNNLFLTLFPNFFKIQNGLQNNEKIIPIDIYIINMTNNLYEKLIEKLKKDPNQKRAKSYIELSKHLKLNEILDEQIINTLNEKYNKIDAKINLDEETINMLNKKYGARQDNIQSVLKNPLHYELKFVFDDAKTFESKQNQEIQK